MKHFLKFLHVKSTQYGKSLRPLGEMPFFKDQVYDFQFSIITFNTLIIILYHINERRFIINVTGERRLVI